MHWQPPAAFDDFEILRHLGAGGMGTVYLARDAALGRPLAIKFVSQTAADPAARERFALEARAIARLHHPNVVAVYRVGSVEGRPYLAYEFVDGRRLDRLPRPLEWQRVLAIGVGLARGLAAAHQAGVLHRDIKPANIMITAAGEVKLLDFGMAKLSDFTPPGDPSRAPPGPLSAPTNLATPASGTHQPVATELIDAPTLVTHLPHARAAHDNRLTLAGTVVGTPLYIAPELWQDAPADARCDLYALGMVLYELLAGRLPLAHLSGDELARAALTIDTPSLAEALPDVPRPLTRLIDRCVRRRPGERPRSAAEVRDALEALSALYRPFVGDDDAGERDAALLAESFVRVQGGDDDLAADFYERWFVADPSVRPLFGADLVQQRRMLTAALKLAIDNLRSPEKLVPLLEELGRRHARYGAAAPHFSTLGHALMASLAELDPEWSPATERAWGAAIARIAQVVQRSMEAELAAGSAPAVAPGRARLDLPLAQPRTQWARRHDAEVAYQVFGNGPLDVLLLGEWVTHLEQWWRHAAPAGFLRRLASLARVIVLDRRGCGLSDRIAAPSLDTALEDILAVLEATSSDQPAVLGLGDGGLVATALAATDPGRVRALVLLGSGTRLRPAGDDATAEARLARARGLARERWGGPLFVEDLAPALALDPTYRRWWAQTLRCGADPTAARRLLDLAARLDVAALAPAVHAPTLLVHRAGDRICAIDQARSLAAAIPGAQLVELPGLDHAPWSGDLEALLAPVHQFLSDLPTASSRARLAATALAARLDAAASASARAAFASAARRELARHHGVPLGPDDAPQLLALFDAPGRAVRCARALAAATAGLPVAFGVEIGELRAGVELSGPVLERAAALARAAELGEVALGPVVRGLVGPATLGHDLPA